MVEPSGEMATARSQPSSSAPSGGRSTLSSLPLVRSQMRADLSSEAVTKNHSVASTAMRLITAVCMPASSRGNGWVEGFDCASASGAKLPVRSSQRYLKFFLRLIMVDRSDDVEGHTRTRERMAHGNVYALVRRPDRVCVSLFRPYRD